jgi:hypothetical protein
MSVIYPYPDNSELAPLFAPYIARYSFDHTVPDGFENFARRYGFMPTPDRLDTSRSLDDLAALMQSWLFFGLIDQLVGSSVDHSSLLTRATDAQGSTVFMVDLRLHAHLDEVWEEAQQKIDVHSCSETLDFANRMCDQFDNIAIPSGTPLDIISLSVRLLLSYFQHTSSLDSKDPFPLPLRHPVALASPSLALLVSRCRHSGLCIRSLYSIGNGLDYPELYYLSFLQKSPRADYHKLCTDTICQEDTEQRKSPTFVAQAYHRVDGCKCHRYGPDQDEVIKVLRSGGIPLLSMESTTDKALKFRVRACTTSSQYVAISHVWSDNQLCSDTNQLHLCQLDYLNRRLIDMASTPGSLNPPSSEPLFWLDTLCIPSGDTFSDLRKQSINEMDLVYAGANQVLVLDAELEELTTKTQILNVKQRKHGVSLSSIMTTILVPHYDDALRVAAHIFRCTWMTRSWTLQEGSLSRSCAIQLQSCAAYVKHLDARTYTDPIQNGPLAAAGRSPLLYPAVNTFALLHCWHLKGDAWIFVVVDYFLIGLCSSLSIFFNIICLPLLLPVFLCRSNPLRWTLIGYKPSLLPSLSQAALRLSNAGQAKHYRKMSDALSSAVTKALHQVDMDTTDTEKLKQTWQSLSGRSTTKPADIPCIIANLVNLNAAEVLNQDTNGKQMRAILFSLRDIPLDFMLTDAPRAGGFQDSDPDHWIPTQARGDVYSSRSVLKMTPDGLLIELDSSESLFMLGGTGFDRPNFTLSTWQPVEERMSLVAAPLDILDVECLNPNQELQHQASGGQVYLLIEKLPSRGTSELARGAILYESRRDGDKVFLSYVSTIRARNHGEDSISPDAYLQLSSARNNFNVECGECANQSLKTVISDLPTGAGYTPLSRRPPNPMSDGYNSSSLKFIAAFFALHLATLQFVVLAIIGTTLTNAPKVHRSAYLAFCGVATAWGAIIAFPLSYALVQRLLFYTRYKIWRDDFRTGSGGHKFIWAMLQTGLGKAEAFGKALLACLNFQNGDLGSLVLPLLTLYIAVIFAGPLMLVLILYHPYK